MRTKFLTVIFLMVLAANLAQADTLDTVTGEYRSSMSLNGAWETLPISGIAFTYPPPETGWTTSPVPNADPASLTTPGGPYRPRVDELLTPDGKTFKRHEGIAAWFRRSFTLPAEISTNQRVVLHFDGMAFHSMTWFNGHLLGDCSIGMIAQDYDVTPFVKMGQTNTLVVGLAGREGLLNIAARSYTAPSSGITTGIWGNVSLNLVPKTNVDDIFVSTSVRQKQLTVATTLVNSLPTSRTVQIDGVVTNDSGEVQCLLPSQSVTIAAGQQTTTTIVKNWMAPRLWSPETPALYFVRMRVHDGQTIIDEQTQRFGFREFWIEGRAFYLNGQRILLRRNSLLVNLSDAGNTVLPDLRLSAGRPFNTIRLHIGFDNARVLDAADKLGLFAMPESSWHTVQQDYPTNKTDVWLPNLITYERALIHANRSRPSVIVWNLTNESYWGTTDPDRMKVSEALIAAAVKEDPTRPQEGDGETTWGGRLPIINVHYPEWDAGDVRAKYPNSSFVVPNDLYWLKDAKTPSHGWRADFVWDRPLMIGEYWCLDGGPDEKSSFMGEAAYDWERWRSQDVSGRDGQPNNPLMNMVKMTTDAYRVQGVAGLNPWAGDRQEVMPSIAVRPLDFHPNFYAGQMGTRKFAVFNDSGNGLGKMILQCNLMVAGVTVWQNKIDVPDTPGKPAIIDVAFKCPDVAKSTQAVLKVRLRQTNIYSPSGAGSDMSHQMEKIYIMPASRWNAAQPTDIVLYDPSGQTAKALHTLGLNLTARKSIAKADLTGCRLIIIGQSADASAMRGVLGNFVAQGGHALLLSVANANALATELPEIDTKHAASQMWLRSHGSAALGGLEEDQLSYWLPDNLVCTNTTFKPTTGKYKILLDTGGRYGLKWTPLVAVSHGLGSFLLSQLNLVDRIGIEPAADQMLLSLIRTERSASVVPRHAFRLLIGNNPALKHALDQCSIATSVGMSGTGPILLDASYTPTAAQIAALKAHLKAGGIIWLHGFTPETITKVAALFPFQPQLVAADPGILTAARRSDDPWMDGISTYDFAWAHTDMSARGDYFAGAKATASIGTYELAASSFKTAMPLTVPAFLTKVPVEKGAILVDTLGWDGALGSEADKAARVITSLALNLGGDVVVAPPKAYHYITTDLSKVANRGYVDDVAGDGKGGWTDQGTNDMRDFLINHTGKNGNMDVPTAAFPAQADFANRPFALVDPKKNDGKSLVVLRGVGHDMTLPSEVTGITIGSKANKLWFLHTGCWVNPQAYEEIGHYLIHYADGTTTLFPIRSGSEIADWWNTAQPTAAKVGWSGKNEVHSPIFVFVAEWSNPHPEKQITTVDLVGGTTSAQVVLFGITAGQEIESAP